MNLKLLFSSAEFNFTEELRKVTKVEKWTSTNTSVRKSGYHTDVNISTDVNTRLYFDNNSHIVLNRTDFPAIENSAIKVLWIKHKDKYDLVSVKNIDNGFYSNLVKPYDFLKWNKYRNIYWGSTIISILFSIIPWYFMLNFHISAANSLQCFLWFLTFPLSLAGICLILFATGRFIGRLILFKKTFTSQSFKRFKKEFNSTIESFLLDGELTQS